MTLSPRQAADERPARQTRGRDRVQEAKAPAPDDDIEEFIFVLNA